MRTVTNGNFSRQIARKASVAAAPEALPQGSNASDEALIAAIAQGDHRAMKLLYGRHSVRVYRFALRFVAEEAVAEDLVNEVFLDVWRKAKSFEGRSQVSTWLLAITRHKAIEILRRPTLDAMDDDACDAIEDAADDPEIAMQKKQNGSILSKCLTNLSPAHREIIDLVYYHQKSIDEVAEIIHAPRNTVKTRMFYARNHLAKLLAETGLDSSLRAG
jgi:RNA polymerase sigma-70 factor, ECF subfamily